MLMVNLSSVSPSLFWQVISDPFVNEVASTVKIRLLSITKPEINPGLMSVTLALNTPHDSVSPTCLPAASKVILSAGEHIPLKAEPVQRMPIEELQL